MAKKKFMNKCPPLGIYPSLLTDGATRRLDLPQQVLTPPPEQKLRCKIPRVGHIFGANARGASREIVMAKIDSRISALKDINQNRAAVILNFISQPVLLEYFTFLVQIPGGAPGEMVMAIIDSRISASNDINQNRAAVILNFISQPSPPWMFQKLTL